MATKEKVEETKKVETKEEPKKPVFTKTDDGRPLIEFPYSASELADCHEVFKTTRDIVTVALKLAGKETATYSEAERIIDRFKNKEVK